MFTDDDLEKIGDIGGLDLEKMVLKIMSVSGLTEDGVEELEKNFDGDLSIVPGSDSPKQLAAQ